MHPDLVADSELIVPLDLTVVSLMQTTGPLSFWSPSQRPRGGGRDQQPIDSSALINEELVGLFHI